MDTPQQQRRLRSVCAGLRSPTTTAVAAAAAGRPRRVLLAGLFHETHSFLEETTALADFDVEVGQELLQHRGDASPLAGALAVADAAGWELLPAADLRATPSGLCEDEVLECFWDHVRALAEGEAAAGRPIDGVYLVLHGAMCSVSFPDTEEELIRRLRALPSLAAVPICGVLDLHGNISQATIQQTQGLVAYRCNPHTDAKDAATRGAELLDRVMCGGGQPSCLYRQLPIVWPPTGVGTDNEPMRSLEAMARAAETLDPGVFHCSVMAGFGYGDCPSTGVSLHLATFGDQAAGERVLDQLSAWAMAHHLAGEHEHRVNSVTLECLWTWTLFDRKLSGVD